MTTIYRTYSPEGDIDHKTPSARDEWITDNDEGVYRVCEQYYNGAVTWDEEGFQASGYIEGAKDITAHVAEMLFAIWSGEDEMLVKNPHELVYAFYDVDDARADYAGELDEMRNRPSCGGV